VRTRLRNLGLAVATAFVCVACGPADAGSTAGVTSTPVPRSSTASSSVPAITETPAPSTPLPSGLASPFGGGLAAGDVPTDELVPTGTEPAGSWFAHTSDGDAIVVAWQAPGDDPFRTDRGVVVWRYTGDPALWTPVSSTTFPAERDPVLGVTATIADVTGDGSQDALVFAATGGSGACGISFVIDPSTGIRVFRRSVCDATIEPSSDPPGLVVTEAVFAHGDPHCCPSAMRTTILQRDPTGGWTTVSETTTPT
jgi:hypothetical protein